jgi:glycosyltransferase involved in cell wall biosynthesis
VKPPPRRIAFLITGLNHGGAETQLLRLATALRDRHWEVLLITLLPGGDFASHFVRAGVPITCLGMRGGRDIPRTGRELVRLLRTWRPAVLASFLFHANILGRLAGRFSGVPVVVSSERSDRFGGRHRYWLLRLTDRLAHATVTNSRLVGERMVQDGIIGPSRLQVIPNAMDPEWPHAELSERRLTRESLGVRADEFLWLAIGRVDSTKDYGTLLRAFELHRRHEPRSILRIAGAGDPAGLLAGLRRTVGDGVGFLGHRDDIRQLLSAADAFVLSSRLEGFPNALMEALAAGVPAVATRVGGVPDLIEDGVTGFLAPAEDDERLAETMTRLTELPGAQRTRLVAAGRERVLRLCDLTRIVDLWESLFLRLMSERGAGSMQTLELSGRA